MATSRADPCRVPSRERHRDREAGETHVLPRIRLSRSLSVLGSKVLNIKATSAFVAPL